MLGAHALQPDAALQPNWQALVSRLPPVASHVRAVSPSHATNSFGAQTTAMQVPGSPPMTPWVSQNGCWESVQTPFAQSRVGFAFVHAPPTTNVKMNTHRIGQ
jgi:hypothetical protein